MMNWNNKAEVLEAVKNDGRAVKYASPRLRDDKKIILIAVKQYGWAIEFASKRLQRNKDVIREAVKSGCIFAKL